MVTPQLCARKDHQCFAAHPHNQFFSFYFYSKPRNGGFLHRPNRTRVLRHQGIDGQERDAFDSRLCY
jgi:hypothetical protein